jgi:hypothetical protein
MIILARHSAVDKPVVFGQEEWFCTDCGGFSAIGSLAVGE